MITQAEKIQKLFKYYKGESQCPFLQNITSELWWGGEKFIYQEMLEDEEFFEIAQRNLLECINSGGCQGPLVDNSIDLNKRTILFILDLWHGKWFPYDDLDVVFTY